MISRTHMRNVGRLCRAVAWLIGIIGLVADAIIFFLNFSSNNEPLPGPSLNYLLSSLVMALVIAVPILFFAFMLYATGIFLGYIGNEQKTREETLRHEDELVTILPLPER